MNKDLQAVKNFDFLARSFAHMNALGQVIDIQAVTGNMDREQRAWFKGRYEQYCRQEAQDRELEMEH